MITRPSALPFRLSKEAQHNFFSQSSVRDSLDSRRQATAHTLDIRSHPFKPKELILTTSSCGESKYLSPLSLTVPHTAPLYHRFPISDSPHTDGRTPTGSNGDVNNPTDSIRIRSLSDTLLRNHNISRPYTRTESVVDHHHQRIGRVKKSTAETWDVERESLGGTVGDGRTPVNNNLKVGVDVGRERRDLDDDKYLIDNQASVSFCFSSEELGEKKLN